jgi:hypothetical protein
MKCVAGKPTKRLIRKIRMLAPLISIVLVFGSTPVFGRGGGHSGGGHAGGGHSGGHSGRSGGHGGHHGGHTSGKHGRITSGTTDSGYFMNQHRCPPTDKTLADCPELGEKQWQEIPAEKAGNRFESRFD